MLNFTQMKLRVIESEVVLEKPKDVTSFVNNMVSAAKEAISPGVVQQEKNALIKFTQTLNDRLNDIHALTQDFGKVLAFILERETQLEGGMAKLSDEERQ